MSKGGRYIDGVANNVMEWVDSLPLISEETTTEEVFDLLSVFAWELLWHCFCCIAVAMESVNDLQLIVKQSRDLAICQQTGEVH